MATPLPDITDPTPDWELEIDPDEIDDPMKGDLTPSQKLVAALCRKYPAASSRTLAKRLHDDNPALFPNLETARTAVRYWLGNHGAKSLRLAVGRGTQRPGRKPGELPPLPQSECRPWEPFVIEAKRTLVLADIHLPYHDASALAVALDYGDSFNPDSILFNGDVFDFYQISRFDKDPTKPKITDELAAGKQLFTHVRKRFPRARLYFRYGNHDRRWDLYLMRVAPLLLDIPSMLDVWHEPAGIPENKVIVIREQRPIMFGKLPVFHGDELPKGMASPVNPARGAFLRTLSSCLHSHLHRTSEHTERTLDDRTITCRTTGCLCGLHPEFARINKWDFGFATIETAKDGSYEVQLKRIIDGKVY